MSPQAAEAAVSIALALTVVASAAFAARTLSRWAAWDPAGPIALIAGAPVLPHVSLFFSLSLDDLLPLVGLLMLVWRRPVPRLTSDRLLRWLLLAVAVVTIARIATAVVNGGGPDGTLKMLAQAIARPMVLVGIVGYVAFAAPESLRHRWVAVSVAAVGTFEAMFGLLAFLVRLPGGSGIEAARQLTSLYGVCPGRITGSLGLSANHLGAVFVLSVPITLGLAISDSSWRRWAWMVAAAAQSAALILTFTRSSIVIAVILSVAFLVYQRRFVVLAAIATLTVATLFAAFSASCHTTPGGSLGGRLSDGNDRMALWYAAGRVALDHPVVGVGLDRMNEVVRANPARYRDTPFGPATSSAHNVILLAAAETGIAGGLGTLGINVGLGVLVLRCAWRARRRERAVVFAMALALAGFLVQGMVNNLFSVPATSMVFALVIGALAGSRPPGSRDPAGDVSPGATPPTGPYTSPSLDPLPSPDGEH